jgi:hypothetical protein
MWMAWRSLKDREQRSTGDTYLRINRLDGGDVPEVTPLPGIAPWPHFL